MLLKRAFLRIFYNSSIFKKYKEKYGNETYADFSAVITSCDDYVQNILKQSNTDKHIYELNVIFTLQTVFEQNPTLKELPFFAYSYDKPNDTVNTIYPNTSFYGWVNKYLAKGYDSFLLKKIDEQFYNSIDKYFTFTIPTPPKEKILSWYGIPNNRVFTTLVLSKHENNYYIYTDHCYMML